MDKNQPTMKAEPDNLDAVGNDIDPQKEKGKGEKVTNYDLKAKKVDADPAEEQEKDTTDQS